MKIQSFIICDDIRREMNNKITLNGIYGTTIEFSEDITFPFGYPIAFYCRFINDTEMTNFETLTFKILMDGDEILKGKGPLKMKGLKKMITIQNKIPAIPIQKEGKLTFEFDFERAGKVVESIVPDYSLEVKTSPNLSQKV